MASPDWFITFYSNIISYESFVKFCGEHQVMIKDYCKEMEGTKSHYHVLAEGCYPGGAKRMREHLIKYSKKIGEFSSLLKNTRYSLNIQLVRNIENVRKYIDKNKISSNDNNASSKESKEVFDLC